MKHLGLICNTMIVTSFFMKLFYKLKPHRRSYSELPKYAIIIPLYDNSDYEGVVVGYADDDYTAEFTRRTLITFRTVYTSLDIKPGVLGYGRITTLNDSKFPFEKNDFIETVKWMEQNGFEHIVLTRIARILNGKLKKH